MNIYVTIATETLGANTDEQNELFLNEVIKTLESEYSDAHVSVELSDNTTATQISANGYEEEISELINMVWNSL